MCAINPKHHIRITLDFYTSRSITAPEFEEQILEWALKTELSINMDGSIRCHASNPTTIQIK